MRRLSALRAYARRKAWALAAVPRRTVVGVRTLVTDDVARPAALYVLALLLGAGSFLSFLLGGGGSPTETEFGLQLGSVGVVFYASLRQAGAGGGRKRR